MKITSGILKGRTLSIKSSQKNNKDLRPTTSYTKNVIFNLLAQNASVHMEIQGKSVLDCFCGTGSMGFEFASHGASFIMFVDSNEENISQIHKNAENLNINYSARVGFFPKCKIKQQFDIIFLDPPYVAAQSQVIKTLNHLMEYSLSENGMIIAELPNNKHSSLIENISKICDVLLTREISDTTTLLFLKKLALQ